MAEEQAEQALVKTLSAKQLKNLTKPKFALEPDKYYPTNVFKKFGFHRAQCPKCKANYWRYSESQTVCGDSQCVGKYEFIGKGCGSLNKKITYAEAWEGFRKSLCSAAIPATAIPRYPVVARWRNDVEYVAAGIYCFQPYCVTGEMEPPANPLICPQFCVRFNDLDNIGITGRHFSGFIMLGIQVFNLPNKYVYFKEECVEFNLRWLIDELKIDPGQITLIEDVWAGGGNLGPCVEYFINGLEVGNMVFMQYKTFHDGRMEELPVKVIDVGIGLERIPWLINGSATSYIDVFKCAYEWASQRLQIQIDQQIWEKFGPYSCLLNVDEIEDVDKTWQQISSQINEPVERVKQAISPIKDLYIVLDHTRTILMIIEDGSLPSNVGGGANVRNILRRVFAIIHKNEWWQKLGEMDGLIELFQKHKLDLQGIYGEFQEYKSFRSVIEVEYERWTNTDKVQKQKLDKLLQKSKGKLTIDDWIICITSYGIPADVVSQQTKQEVPGNIYSIIAERQDQLAPAAEQVLYSTAHLPPTDSLYYAQHNLYEFQGKIVDVFANQQQNNIKNIVILDVSAFYPFSGGQVNDTGRMEIEGQMYNVVNVEKCGHAVLHFLDRPLDENKDYKGIVAQGFIDQARRIQLRNHHTSTHIVFAACRKVLGPHIWQHGAKKTMDQAHLDVTHYKSLTRKEEQDIEDAANRIVMEGKKINKYWMEKPEAEKRFGFHLYQGGVIPGNQLRIVNISDTDTEACCGTHCDYTNEVGWIHLVKSIRISDGIVRLYFTAGEKTIDKLNGERNILLELSEQWGVPQPDLISTANRFFQGYKKFQTKVQNQDQQILNLVCKNLILDPQTKLGYSISDQPNPTLYFSFLNQKAGQLKEFQKGIIFIGKQFIHGLLGATNILDPNQLLTFATPIEEGKQIKTTIKNKVGAKNQQVSDVCEFSIIANINSNQLLGFLNQAGFKKLEM